MAKSFKTFWYSLKRSLTDFSYYKEVAKAPFTFSLKYLYLIVLFFTLLTAIQIAAGYASFRPSIQPAVNDFMTRAKTFYPNDLKINIVNGNLSVNVPQPFVVPLKKSEQTESYKNVLVIDTSAKIDDYPAFKTYILATKNALIYPSRQSQNDFSTNQIFYFSSLKNNISVDKSIYDKLLTKVSPYAYKATQFTDVIAVLFTFAYVVFGSVFKLLGILMGLLILALVVWVFNLIFKKGHDFSEVYKMSMHAITWPIIVSEVLNYFNLIVPGAYVIVFFIFVALAIFF